MTAVNIPKMMIVEVSKELNTDCTINNPIKFKGGPGSPGTIQPARPARFNKMAKISNVISIFLQHSNRAGSSRKLKIRYIIIELISFYSKREIWTNAFLIKIK